MRRHTAAHLVERARTRLAATASAVLDPQALGEPAALPRGAAAAAESARQLAALARRRSLNHAAWKAQLQRAAASCSSGEANDITRVLNACARSPIDPFDAARACLERSRRLIKQCSARHLALLLNALARLDLRDEPLLHDCALELRLKFKKCSIRDAALIANAYARLHYADRDIFGQLLPAYIDSCAPRFRVKDLAQVLNAYAKVQMRSTTTFAALSYRCADQAEHMDCQAVSTIAHAHACLLIVDEPLLRTLADRLRVCSRTCTLQGVSMLFYAYAKFSFEAEPAAAGRGHEAPELGSGALVASVFAGLVGELRRFAVQDMTARSLSTMAHAVAKTGYHRSDPDLVVELARYAVGVGLQEFEPSSLSVMGLSFAEMWPLNPAASADGGLQDGPSDGAELQQQFWSDLAAASAEATTRLGPSDAANLGLAFATAQLPATAVGGLQLAHHVAQAPSPALAMAIYAAHARCRLWDGVAFSELARQAPSSLWQASDAVACRLGLAMWLATGWVVDVLREAIAPHVVRCARQQLDEAVEAPDLVPQLLVGSQGFVAVAAPTLPFSIGTQVSGSSPAGAMPWFELGLQRHEGGAVTLDILREARCSHQDLSAEVLEAGDQLASMLATQQHGNAAALVRRLLKASRARGSSRDDLMAQALESFHRLEADAPQASMLETAAAVATPPAPLALLMPSVAAPGSVATAAARSAAAARAEGARRISRALRQQRVQLVLGASTPPLSVGDVAVLTRLDDAHSDEQVVPACILVGGPGEELESAGSDVAGSEAPRLTTEAELRAFLLASEGWLVVRLRLADLEQYRHASGEAATEPLGEGLLRCIRDAARRWLARAEPAAL